MITNQRQDNRTLRQKLLDHWNSRDRIFQPEPETANKLGCAFVLIFSLSLLYSTCRVMLPHLANWSRGKYICGLPVAFHYIVAVFVFVQLLLNWGLCALKDLNRVSEKRTHKAVENYQQKTFGNFDDEDKYASAESGKFNDKASDHGNISSISTTQINQRNTVRNSKISPFDTEALGFHNCPYCQMSVPARAFHCKVCRMCVLKRDHHCYFTASCIGHFTQRYFIMFTFYAVIGTAYFMLISFLYYKKIYKHPNFLSLTKYLPPVTLALLLNSAIHLKQFLLIIQSFLSLSVCLFASSFLCWQCCLLANGATSYELSHMSGAQYRAGSLREELRRVFGSYWLGNLLFPLRTLPEGDGYFWKMEKTCKGQ